MSGPNRRTAPDSNHAWRMIYADAVAEKDPEKLSEKVGAAEAAIFQRLQELTKEADSSSERFDLRQAAEKLLALKTDTLNFPGWRKE